MRQGVPVFVMIGSLQFTVSLYLVYAKVFPGFLIAVWPRIAWKIGY
jgi:hypothetical protein